MREYRGRIIYLSLLVAESIWLYAALGLIGAAIGIGGSPMPWLVVLFLLAATMAFAWVVGGSRGDPASLAIIHGAVSLVAVYLAVGASAAETFPGMDLAWLPRLVGGDYDGSRVARTILAALAALVFARRAFGLVADRYAAERLLRAFKIGMAVLAISVLVEQAGDVELGTGLLLIPFFAATLAGLAVARLPEEGENRNAGAWARVIAISVFSVLGIGLVLGLIGGLYGSGGVRLLFAGWGLLVDSLLWLIRYPAELLVYMIAAFARWLRSLFNPSGQELELTELGPPPERPPLEPGAEETGNALLETIVNIIQYPLLVILLIAMFLILALAYRRLLSKRRQDKEEDRESIRGDADAAGDLARLLKKLLPGWLTGGRNAGQRWRHPSGDPGIVEVFLLYFRALDQAVRRGMAFEPNQTPSERLPLLEAALPGAPVAQVTARFNAACYGQEPTDRATLERLRQEMDSALAPHSRQPSASPLPAGEGKGEGEG